MATSKAPFKVGDVVEMIPERSHPLLRVGRPYKILGVVQGRFSSEYLVKVDCGGKIFVFASRFKLVDEFEGNV